MQRIIMKNTLNFCQQFYSTIHCLLKKKKKVFVALGGLGGLWMV